MGYASCSCELCAACESYTEDGGTCIGCAFGRHGGYGWLGDGDREESAGVYDPPDPMEREP